MLLWAEPGVPAEALRERTAFSVAFKRYLELQLLEGAAVDGIRLVVYSSAASYAESRGIRVDSHAHFHRDSRLIHIPVTAPESVWKHEIVHAVLHARNPTLPWWIQEGTALLLQSTGDHPLCRMQALSLPANVVAYRQLLLERRLHLPLRAVGGEPPEDVYSAKAQAAFFAFFLWQRGLLLNVIHHQLAHPETTAFLHLTAGDMNRYDEMETEFYRWLATESSAVPSRGC